MGTPPNEFGIVGLGRMGGNLARQALGKGIRVAGFDPGAVEPDLIARGLKRVETFAGFREDLARPRAVFIYIPAGRAIDVVLESVAPALEPGDVIVDGGNSYWGDSIRRHRRLAAMHIQFVDLGTSGGVEGALRGACFMAGGEQAAVERIEPILVQLAVPGGYVHAGSSGAGHFTKLVHNGIEFGMLQAIGEGVDLLEHFRDRLRVADILRAWQHGSVIRSWLIELMENAYRAEGGLDRVPGYVEDTGEVNWLVDDAVKMEVPVPVIAQAVMQLLLSRDDRRNWARAIAMMRQGFGGHPYGPDAGVARIRATSRVAGFEPPDTIEPDAP